MTAPRDVFEKLACCPSSSAIVTGYSSTKPFDIVGAARWRALLDIEVR